MPRSPALTRTAVALAATALLLTGCGADDEDDDAGASTQKGMQADLLAADGAKRGTVRIAFDGDRATVTVKASGLAPGLHGFHVHAAGVCAPDSVDPADANMKGPFLSAGGHVAEAGQSHGSHDGDLPSLLVAADGTAELVTTSDRLSEDAVLDADGSAVMVHEQPDNFGNVPERYTTAIDDKTKKTGDAGARVACAVIKG